MAGALTEITSTLPRPSPVSTIRSRSIISTGSTPGRTRAVNDLSRRPILPPHRLIRAAGELAAVDSGRLRRSLAQDANLAGQRPSSVERFFTNVP